MYIDKSSTWPQNRQAQFDTTSGRVNPLLPKTTKQKIKRKKRTKQNKTVQFYKTCVFTLVTKNTSFAAPSFWGQKTTKTQTFAYSFFKQWPLLVCNGKTVIIWIILYGVSKRILKTTIAHMAV